MGLYIEPIHEQPVSMASSLLCFYCVKPNYCRIQETVEIYDGMEGLSKGGNIEVHL